MASPPLWNCLHRVPSQEGGQEWPETESWLAPNSFRHSWPSLGGSKEQQPLSLCLCSSFSLPGLSPCFHFLSPSSLSLPPSFTFSPSSSFSHFPTNLSPSPVHPSLEADFLLSHPFFCLRAQNHTWQSSPPTSLPSTLSSSSLSFPPLLQFSLPSPSRLILLSLPHSP